jgi:hypothetical protein
MPLKPTPESREECRREVLNYLAERSSVALSRDSIRRGLKHEWGFEDAEILHACEFLVGLDLISSRHGDLGATRYYQITSKGTLHHERNS